MITDENTLTLNGITYEAKEAEILGEVCGQVMGLCEGCALQKLPAYEEMKCPTVPHCCGDYRADKRNIIWIEKLAAT